MALYGIADLHLSFTADKPMDIYGSAWENHTKRLEENWRRTISQEDTVIIAGDISWGLKLDEAIADLEWIHALPGFKVLFKGNHDPWWTSISRLNSLFDDMYFVQNSFYPYGDTAICGTRGWLCPGSSEFTAHDRKIYDREQLRYRLAPGKDPLLTEQDAGLEDTFATGIQEHLTRYTVPATGPYLAKDGQAHETIAEGQAFRGTVYGPDAAIRQIAESVSRFPVAQLGMLTEEGLGEVYFRIPAVKEAAIPAEQLSRCFDVCCLSDTLILNDRGVPGCRAEDLLSEIEYVLGCPGKLRIIGKYTAVHEDCSRNPGWQEDRTVVRCLAKGEGVHPAA